MNAPDLHVSVIVLNYRNVADTVECLASLLDSAEQSPRIVVCDNASGDGSVEVLQAWSRSALPEFNQRRSAQGMPAYSFRTSGPEEAPGHGAEAEIVLIETGSNLGYGGGNNVGIRYALRDARCSHVWVLNNDTIVDPHALRHLTARMAEDPGIGLCGATLCYIDEPQRVQMYGGAGFRPLSGRAIHLGSRSRRDATVDRPAIERQLRYISGACALVSRAFLEQVGLMEEKYFLYFEELEWANRARGRFKLAWAPDAIVLHKVGGSIGSREFEKPSALSEYYIRRNRMLYCLEHSAVSVPMVLVRLAKDLAVHALQGDFARVSLIWRATLDGAFRSRGGHDVAPPLDRGAPAAGQKPRPVSAT